MFRIVRAPASTVEANLHVVIDRPVIAFVGIDADEIVGSGGLAWGGGRCWIWFKMMKTKPAYAVAVIRATKKALRMAAQLGETTVYTPRDAQFPSSQKLLETLGFEMQGIENGYEVWAWRS